MEIKYRQPKLNNRDPSKTKNCKFCQAKMKIIIDNNTIKYYCCNCKKEFII